MAVIYGTTITVPTIVGTHTGYVAQIKTGDVPALMLNGANQIDNGGGNLQVYTNDTLATRLGVDIVECVTGGTPSFLAYVRMPSAATGQTIYLAADDTQTVQPIPSASYGSEEVNQDYEAVIHANETGTNGVFVDSTGNGRNTSLFYGASLPTTSSGHPWNSTWPDFDFSQGLEVASSDAIINNSAFTISCWMNVDTSSQFDNVLSNRASSGAANYASMLSSSRVDTSAGGNLSTINNGGLSTGAVYFRKITQTTAFLKSYINGVVDGSVANPNAGNGELLTVAQNYFIGTFPYSTSGSINGRCGEILIKRSEDSEDYTLVEYNNRISSTWFSNDGWNAVSGGSFTLDIDGGVYTSTGGSVDLLLNRSLSVNGGNYSASGANINLLFNRSINTDGGIYNTTGSPLDLLFNRQLLVDGGSYTYTGSAVTLVYNPSTGFVMDVDGGVYGMTGGHVGTLYNRVIDVDGGNYSTSGANLALLYNRSLNVDGGVYSTSGGELSLLLDRVIQVDGGNYSYTGSAVGLIYSGQITLLIDCYSVEFKQDSVSISYAEDDTRVEYGCLQ